MITPEDDVDAHALHRQCWTISAIARHLGRDRTTISADLSGGRVTGQRASGVPDPFEQFAAYCAQRLSDDPHVWAATLFDESSRALGFDRFLSGLHPRPASTAPGPYRIGSPDDGATSDEDNPLGRTTACGIGNQPNWRSGELSRSAG